jgi:hypothetical protein
MGVHRMFRASRPGFIVSWTWSRVLKRLVEMRSDPLVASAANRALEDIKFFLGLH